VLRALSRFVGYIGLAAGFIAFVVDGARYIANNEWVFLPVGTAIDAVLPRAFAGWETVAKLQLPQFLWDPVLVRALSVPFFAVAAVIGIVLLFLGRKPKALIGYSSRD
jgi:hypothetical protein